MTLLDRLTGRKPPLRTTAFSLDEYAQMLNQFQLGGYGYTGIGLQQTIAGTSTERPADTFAGIASQAYAANGVVFACMLVRQLVFSSVRFQWQRLLNGSPSDTFGDQTLALVERPWPGGTTQDLLSRMIQDADLAGNSYWVRQGDELVRLRPDWVQVIGKPRHMGTSDSGRGGVRSVGSRSVTSTPRAAITRAIRTKRWHSPSTRSCISRRSPIRSPCSRGCRG